MVKKKTPSFSFSHPLIPIFVFALLAILVVSFGTQASPSGKLAAPLLSSAALQPTVLPQQPFLECQYPVKLTPGIVPDFDTRTIVYSDSKGIKIYDIGADLRGKTADDRGALQVAAFPVGSVLVPNIYPKIFGAHIVWVEFDGSSTFQWKILNSGPDGLFGFNAQTGRNDDIGPTTVMNIAPPTYQNIQQGPTIHDSVVTIGLSPPRGANTIHFYCLTDVPSTQQGSCFGGKPLQLPKPAPNKNAIFGSGDKNNQIFVWDQGLPNSDIYSLQLPSGIETKEKATARTEILHDSMGGSYVYSVDANNDYTLYASYVGIPNFNLPVSSTGDFPRAATAAHNPSIGGNFLIGWERGSAMIIGTIGAPWEYQVPHPQGTTGYSPTPDKNNVVFTDFKDIYISHCPNI